MQNLTVGTAQVRELIQFGNELGLEYNLNKGWQPVSRLSFNLKACSGFPPKGNPSITAYVRRCSRELEFMKDDLQSLAGRRSDEYIDCAMQALKCRLHTLLSTESYQLAAQLCHRSVERLVGRVAKSEADLKNDAEVTQKTRAEMLAEMKQSSRWVVPKTQLEQEIILFADAIGVRVTGIKSHPEVGKVLRLRMGAPRRFYGVSPIESLSSMELDAAKNFALKELDTRANEHFESGSNEEVYASIREIFTWRLQRLNGRECVSALTHVALSGIARINFLSAYQGGDTLRRMNKAR